MSWYCWSCGMYVADGETHVCGTSALPYRWYYPYNASWYGGNILCERKNCIYHSNQICSGADDFCTNPRIMLNSKGKCISYVKKKDVVKE